MSPPLFDYAVCTIFARETLEAILIIGNYRKVIQEGEEFKADPPMQQAALKAVTWAASIASLVAVVMIAIVVTILWIVHKGFDKNVGYVIEGVSKVVAAIFILQLSYKLPKWLGVYAAPKKDYNSKIDGLSLRSIKFNIAWNIWREVAECGAFLIPFFLGEKVKSIPVSGIVGIVVGVASGVGIFWAANNMQSKNKLAFFLAAVTGQLSVGLFTGGCHEFEIVWGMTPEVWRLDAPFWDYKKLPLTLIKPFGYSHVRTVLQICCFWGWMFLTLGIHYKKWSDSQKFLAENEADNGNNEKASVIDVEEAKEESFNDESATNVVFPVANVDADAPIDLGKDIEK